MSFQPFVLGSGLPGWKLLNVTLSTQKAAFNSSQPILSETQYFLDRFSSINSPDDIVSDRRLMRVILGAYGLSDDIENRHFIKSVMAEGVADSDALANLLADRRYRALARDYDFSSVPPGHKTARDLATKTIEDYRNQSFEAEIGKSDGDMRLALGFSRELNSLLRTTSTNSAAWYQILATPPLREVFQTSLGLPREFAQLDIDEQHSRIQEKATLVFGSSEVSDLLDNERIEQVTRRFLIMRQAEVSTGSTSLQTALLLLSSIPKWGQ